MLWVCLIINTNTKFTRCVQQVPRLIFLLGCGYTSGHPSLQGGVLELPLSLGQGMVPARLSVLCELRSKRVMYLSLVIVRAVRDVRRARAARVHQVLCETGKKWCGDIWNVENCFRWAVFESCSHSKRLSKKCFQQWQDHWKQCVSKQGEYFENYYIFLAISNKL